MKPKKSVDSPGLLMEGCPQCPCPNVPDFIEFFLSRRQHIPEFELEVQGLIEHSIARQDGLLDDRLAALVSSFTANKLSVVGE